MYASILYNLKSNANLYNARKIIHNYDSTNQVTHLESTKERTSLVVTASSNVETFLLINASSCFLFAFTCFPSLSLSLCFHFCFPSHKPLMSVFRSYFYFIFFLLLPVIYPWSHGSGTTVGEKEIERET